MKVFTLIALLLITHFVSISQTTLNISGVVKTKDGTPLSNASVILYYKGSADSLRTPTGDNGEFSFKNLRAADAGMVVSHIGYKTSISFIDLRDPKAVSTPIIINLLPGEDMLEGITLESNKVQIKEDTVTFLIDSTMYRKNDNVEEVLKKLPGVQVDKDGTVTAQGKQVTKVKVNGKEFFGGDVTTATRELNADMVDRIQVIDDYGDQSAFTGVKDGDPTKTLNIDLKKDKNKGYFGNATAGAGTQGRYLANLSVNKFNNSQQISLIGNLNNTNASTFNFGNMGGAMGNMVGGIVRSLGIGRGGGGFAAALGNLGLNDGISTTKSIGINYRDEWGSGVSVYGSYSFSRRGTNTIKEITQYNSSSQAVNLQHSTDYTLTDNHRLSFNMEYKIDSFNYLKLTPTVSYTESATDNAADFLYTQQNNKRSSGTTNQYSQSNVPNLGASLLFNHRFIKRGRTLSMNLNASGSSNNADNNYENNSTIYFPNNDSANQQVYQYISQNNKTHSYGARASYIEPLSKKRSLEFNYAFNNQFTGNDKETFDVNPGSGVKNYNESQSNIYDNTYITNKFGFNFRTNEKKYNYTVGFAIQPATIRSNSISGKYNYTQQLLNYYPVVRFAYNFSRSRSFNINYNGTTTQPSYSQLQPVYDSSNIQYITVGNPNLKPEFTNTLSMRYNNFDFITGNVFFSNISFSFTKDKIVNNVIDRGFGSQETRYLNSDGFYTLFGFYNFSKPIQNRKYVFNLGGNITYNNNISFIEGVKDRGANFLVGQRFATDIKIKKWLETSAGVNYTLNSSKYKVSTQLNSDATAWTLTHSSRFFLPKNFRLNYDIDQSFNTGYAANVNSSPLIINAGIEKAFFKKQNASLKLQAFDLLDQNTSINRTVTGNSITDTRSNKLGRYYLLSFIIRLNKFSGQASGNPMMPGMKGDMNMMRPPGM